MSAKVDVLAVMDQDRRLLSATLVASDRAKELLRQHDEARAAVTELIELMHEANAKYIPRPTSINTKRLATQVAFNDRLDALLFRIGPQS